MADEVRRVAKKGCHAITFSENPEKLGWPELPQRPLGPVLAGVLGRGHRRLPAHRVVVADRHDRGRRADRRDDHAAADQHRAGRGRPAVVAGVPEVPRPDSSPCPRAGSAGSRTSSSGLDYVYQHHRVWTGTDFGDQLPSEVFREHVIFCFINDAVGRGEPRTTSASTASRWECDYPHSDSTWPTSPELLSRVRLDRRPRRRDQQDDPRERDAVLPVRPVRPPTSREGARSARCGPRPLASTSRSRAAARPPGTPARAPSRSSTSSTPPAPT